MNQHTGTVPLGQATDRLDRALAALAGVSRGQARRWVDAGAVFVDGKRCRVSSRPIQGGARLAWTPGADTLPVGPPATWRYRDELLAVVDKPAGMPTDATTASVRGTLRAWLEAEGCAHVGLPHRLDHETTGLILVSLHPSMDRVLSEYVLERRIVRTYHAVLAGSLPGDGGSWAHTLVQRDGRRVAAPPDRGGPQMRSRWARIGGGADVTWVALTLETGRTHQLRLQAAAEGAPIVGDRLSGRPHPAGLHLQAARLDVPHPATGETISIVAPAAPWLRDDARAPTTTP
jgi:23S rRNA pseudouridine1911/1915/1917 synthase